MNLCIFSGRLTKDAETRYTQSSKAVSNFGLAVDTGYGDRKTTVFLNCVLWDREKLAPHLTKGKPVTISGEYTERKWQDRDGNERRIVEINVRDLEFQQGQPGQGQAKQDGQQRPQRGGQDEGPAFPSETADIDSVPF